MRNPAKETAAKHERIVKEASRLFREREFDNLTVGEVMKAADSAPLLGAAALVLLIAC